MNTHQEIAPNIAQEIILKVEALGVMLASAESCTGGMIAAALTDIAGSSVAVDRGNGHWPWESRSPPPEQLLSPSP